jgi:hypothetical protein
MSTLSTPRVASRLAFCIRCEGVIPFREVHFRAAGPVLPGPRHTGLICTRCRSLFTQVDPAAAGRHRAWRYIFYAAGAAAAMVLGAVTSSMGSASQGLAAVQAAAFGLAVLLTLTCLGRGLWLAAQASRFETLEPYEVEDLDRRLCPGMLRSEVIDDLSRRGWRPGKIRSVLSGLRQLPTGKPRIEFLPLPEDQPSWSR